jgi:hypothetical protein
MNLNIIRINVLDQLQVVVALDQQEIAIIGTFTNSRDARDQGLTILACSDFHDVVSPSFRSHALHFYLSTFTAFGATAWK